MLKTVVIVEDDRALREELVRILNAAPEIQCLHAFATAEEALAQIPRRVPDVVLMDIRLPGMSGIECVAALKESLPNLRFLMFTVYEDSDRIFRALRAGASGYLLKSTPPEEVYAAIHDVHGGGAPMSSHIARKVIQHFHSEGQVERHQQSLSSREVEVLNLLAAGLIYKEIGDKLHIGVETVRTHVKHICAKLHVRSRLEAVAKHRLLSGRAGSQESD